MKPLVEFFQDIEYTRESQWTFLTCTYRLHVYALILCKNKGDTISHTVSAFSALRNSKLCSSTNGWESVNTLVTYHIVVDKGGTDIRHLTLFDVLRRPQLLLVPPCNDLQAQTLACLTVVGPGRRLQTKGVLMPLVHIDKNLSTSQSDKSFSGVQHAHIS